MQNVRVWVAAEFFDQDLEFHIAATAGKTQLLAAKLNSLF